MVDSSLPTMSESGRRVNDLGHAVRNRDAIRPRNSTFMVVIMFANSLGYLLYTIPALYRIIVQQSLLPSVSLWGAKLVATCRTFVSILYLLNGNHNTLGQNELLVHGCHSSNISKSLGLGFVKGQVMSKIHSGRHIKIVNTKSFRS